MDSAWNLRQGLFARLRRMPRELVYLFLKSRFGARWIRNYVTKSYSPCMFDHMPRASFLFSRSLIVCLPFILAIWFQKSYCPPFNLTTYGTSSPLQLCYTVEVKKQLRRHPPETTRVLQHFPHHCGQGIVVYVVDHVVRLPAIH